MTDEVRLHLEQLAATGIIRPSHSPWASSVVLVRKHDGNLRMCIDYRQLNKRTIKYALPRIEEILDTLSGSKCFTVPGYLPKAATNIKTEHPWLTVIISHSKCISSPFKCLFSTVIPIPFICLAHIGR